MGLAIPGALIGADGLRVDKVRHYKEKDPITQDPGIRLNPIREIPRRPHLSNGGIRSRRFRLSLPDQKTNSRPAHSGCAGPVRRNAVSSLNSRLSPMVNDSPHIPDSLLDAARSGDETAWRELVELLYPLVAGTIRNHLRREADRDDVVQEVFVKIFANLGQYAGRQPFDHWVSRITLNACRDWLRRIAARPVTSYSDLTDDEREIIQRTLASDAPPPDETPAMLHDLLDRMIGALAPREQIVIRMLDLEQRSVQDVCNQTGWGTSKVKVTAMRARRKLAEQMQRMETPSSTLTE